MSREELTRSKSTIILYDDKIGKMYRIIDGIKRYI